MKRLVAVLAIIVAASAQLLDDKEKEKLTEFGIECALSTDISFDTLEKAKNGVFVGDPKMKDFMICMAKKTGMMDEKGRLQHDVIRKKIGPKLLASDLPKIVLGCHREAHASNTDIFANLVKCLYDKAKINLLA